MLTYNRAPYLKQAIDSVCTQSYKNWQLIVIDDGSTDKTPTLMEHFNDPRIMYVRHEENAGLHARRVESLTHATGEYVAVLDSDDYWSDREKLSAQVTFLESHSEHVLVGTFTNLINAAGHTVGQDVFATNDQAIRQNIFLRNQFTHSAVLMRRTALDQTKGYQDTLAEDLELFLQLGTLGKLANLPVYATAHRIHEGSANDRGINMATAVHHIIKAHRSSYPRYLTGYTKSLLRLFIARLKQVAKK